ncbi:MAG: 16S rRNA (adenine(1518)-N(6)/adenine(1519)-N(6))-dimethyltransferase RsmA [Firmicutes bacterium]|nr:16S rRNA (adenine(1518)-N(6)/adenine(1519)-N(6))-dimethyltransferase RsmA [Bacillota bacterium]
MEIKDALIKHNFKFKKSLGQNFISDTNLLIAIAKDALVNSEDTVVEVGAGAGALTRILCERAKRVIIYEIDRALEPVLKETLKDFNNYEIIYKDILKVSAEEIKEKVNGAFKVVANLPYYITTPVIMKFLESDLELTSLTVMVQKEVARRLTAKENTEDYGSITLAVKLKGEAKITREVSRKLFFPPPNVDSAVVTIVANSQKYECDNMDLLKRLIRAGFQMRRKTLSNNISAEFGVTKEIATNAIVRAGYDLNIRGEALNLNDYINIAGVLFKE